MSELDEKMSAQETENRKGLRNDEKVEEDENLGEIDEEVENAREKIRRKREARAQALTLEIVGDLPYAEVKPPENVLFVCKLNPVTEGQSVDPATFTNLWLTGATQQTKIWIRYLVVSVPSCLAKSSETSVQKIACNMHSSNLRTRRTASRRISRCKES